MFLTELVLALSTNPLHLFLISLPGLSGDEHWLRLNGVLAWHVIDIWSSISSLASDVLLLYPVVQRFSKGCTSKGHFRKGQFEALLKKIIVVVFLLNDICTLFDQ